jgi:tetratricopeptide (TPR) repeat protein
MIVHLILFIAVVNGILLCPNEAPLSIGQDVTVSAGIPQEQLQLEAECDRLIKQAQTMIKDADITKALACLDSAWELTQKHAFLTARKPSIAAERGHAYMLNGDYKQAVLAFKARLDYEKRSCDKKYDASPYAIGCGEALLELGSAEMRLGDNATALFHLREAAACYEIFMDKGQDSAPLAKLGYKLYCGEARVLAGIAAARVGDKKDAMALINAGIENLEKVRTDPISTGEMKEMATRAVAFSKDQLSILE